MNTLPDGHIVVNEQFANFLDETGFFEGIPLTDFSDDIDEEGEDMFSTNSVGRKGTHVSGIEGVITSTSGGYYWLTHSGGIEAFIHCGEVNVGETATPEQLEEYLGHSNGLATKGGQDKTAA